MRALRLIVVLCAGALSAWLLTGAVRGKGDPALPLEPAPLTSGHHQLGVRCDACHVQGKGVSESACLKCHAELVEIDSHGKARFADPRQADRLARLDARRCTACHAEHSPERTLALGVTQPPDFCLHCHRDIGVDRPSHQGFQFQACNARGCHNFHDNRALYEDFVARHMDERVPSERLAPERSLHQLVRQAILSGDAIAGDESGELPDTPDATPGRGDARIVQEWQATLHYSAGVGCESCHVAGGERWTDKPGPQACATCHSEEAKGFFAGKHGMRLSAGLGPMTPSLARAAMQPTAADKQLSCTACHAAHRFDVKHAAAQACLGCHADEHSVSWDASPHATLFRAEAEGLGPKGSGVSCATCHLPRVAQKRRLSEVLGAAVRDAPDDEPELDLSLVRHDQSSGLRPNSKMARDVCLRCHTLAESLDALADPALVRANFRGRPAAHVQTVDLVRARRAAVPPGGSQ